MNIKLLTEHHLKFVSLKGGCTCSFESILVKCHIVGNHVSQLICVYLSYDVASGSEIMACNKVDKPLVVCRFSRNVMTSITKLRTE